MLHAERRGGQRTMTHCANQRSRRDRVADHTSTKRSSKGFQGSSALLQVWFFSSLFLSKYFAALRWSQKSPDRWTSRFQLRFWMDVHWVDIPRLLVTRVTSEAGQNPPYAKSHSPPYTFLERATVRLPVIFFWSLSTRKSRANLVSSYPVPPRHLQHSLGYETRLLNRTRGLATSFLPLMKIRGWEWSCFGLTPYCPILSLHGHLFLFSKATKILTPRGLTGWQWLTTVSSARSSHCASRFWAGYRIAQDGCGIEITTSCRLYPISYCVKRVCGTSLRVTPSQNHMMVEFFVERYRMYLHSPRRLCTPKNVL